MLWRMKGRILAAAAALLLATPAAAETLRMVTWNGGGEGARWDEFATAIDGADIIALQETTAERTHYVARVLSGEGWNPATTAFGGGERPVGEVGVIARRLADITEVDPYPDGNAPLKVEMALQAPAWWEAQGPKPGRGFLWVELPEHRLVVIVVHLKSSLGAGATPEDIANAHAREWVAASLMETVATDVRQRPRWSHVILGDVNVPAGGRKAGMVVDDADACDGDGTCVAYDQTHVLLSGGFHPGLGMQHLTAGLGPSFEGGGLIDVVYARGPILARTRALRAELLPRFGSDHHAVAVTLELGER